MPREIAHVSSSWFPDVSDPFSVEQVMSKRELLQRFCDDYAEKYMYQLEKCPTTGKLHFQYTIKLLKLLELDDIRKLMQDKIERGIDVRPLKKHPAAAFRYCDKDPSRIDGPWCHMEDAKVNNDYKGKDLPVKLLHWQDYICRRLLESLDNRRIYWLFDKLGSHGKSTLVKWMAYYHNAIILDWADMKDCACAVSRAKDKKIIIFNLMRSKPARICHQDLYAAIEACKDGIVFSPKYESGQVIWEGSNVLVLSNFEPDLDRLSRDRWDILDISRFPQVFPPSTNEPRLVDVLLSSGVPCTAVPISSNE